MKLALTQRFLASVLIMLALTATGRAQGTIFNFLGVPKGVNKIQDNLLNRRGNRPNLERKPPLKALSDPEFLKPEIAEGIKMPKALQEAAKVKIQEDLAPQKIKAVKFLASMGCGCYNDDGGIVDALAEALADCTEDVRMATIKALQEVAEGETCSECKSKSCCDEKLLKKLAEIAFDRDETGCYKERNEKVRAAALEALEACCPSTGPIVVDEGMIGPDEVETPPLPDVVPETPNSTSASLPNSEFRHQMTSLPSSEWKAPIVRAPIVRAPVVRAPVAQSPAATAPLVATWPGAVANVPHEIPVDVSAATSEPPLAARPTNQSRSMSGNTETIAFTNAVLGRTTRVVETAVVQETRIETRPEPKRVTPVVATPPVLPAAASVDWVNANSRSARIKFNAAANVPVGTELEVLHEYVTGRAVVGRFAVSEATADGAIIHPVGRTRITSIARGDEARFLR